MDRKPAHGTVGLQDRRQLEAFSRVAVAVCAAGRRLDHRGRIDAAVYASRRRRGFSFDPAWRRRGVHEQARRARLARACKRRRPVGRPAVGPRRPHDRDAPLRRADQSRRDRALGGAHGVHAAGTVPLASSILRAPECPQHAARLSQRHLDRAGRSRRAHRGVGEHPSFGAAARRARSRTVAVVTPDRSLDEPTARTGIVRAGSLTDRVPQGDRPAHMALFHRVRIRERGLAAAR